jgi:hypothetical protein
VVLIEDILVLAEAAKGLPDSARSENTPPSCFRPLIVSPVVEAAAGLCSLSDKSSSTGSSRLRAFGVSDGQN